MTRAFGLLLGVVWLGLAYGAFRNSSAGWATEHADLGFWWAVIGSLLTVAALGLIGGTLLHAGKGRG